MMIPHPPKRNQDIPGFNNQQHLKSLMAFASSIPENSKVLEIGCAWGLSSWALMDSLPEGCKLHVCDTFGLNGSQKQTHYNGVMKKNSNNPAIVYAMNLYMEKDHRTVYDYCASQHPKYFSVHKKTHQMKSIELLKQDSKWDMVYLDGAHSYRNVKNELKYLNGTQYLCGDDYHPAHDGVMRAVDEFLRNNKYIFKHDNFDTASGFWKMEKIND